MNLSENILPLILILCIASAASAVCYKERDREACCKQTNFDSEGNCSPWFHKCPDQLIGTNIKVNRTKKVAFGEGGRQGRLQQNLDCEYQPRKCEFIGCSDDGDPVTEECVDSIVDPSSSPCPTGGVE